MVFMELAIWGAASAYTNIWSDLFGLKFNWFIILAISSEKTIIDMTIIHTFEINFV